MKKNVIFYQIRANQAEEKKVYVNKHQSLRKTDYTYNIYSLTTGYHRNQNFRICVIENKPFLTSCSQLHYDLKSIFNIVFCESRNGIKKLNHQFYKICRENERRRNTRNRVYICENVSFHKARFKQKVCDLDICKIFLRKLNAWYL